MVSRDDQPTQRHAAVRDPEQVFAAFVDASNAESANEKITRGPISVRPEARRAEASAKGVARVVRSSSRARETAEANVLSAAELENAMKEVATYIEHGYAPEARNRLSDLCAAYPGDCVLLTRAGEMYVKLGMRDDAMKTFLAVADRRLEDGDTNAVRRALDEVLAIDPGHRRAHRILVTLSRRPDTRSPREGRLRAQVPSAGR